uniref:Putative secreted protein n=1 Tax=Anopheles darlingi TaxID=43151 RepID=A0A2M4DLN2_ANODA
MTNHFGLLIGFAFSFLRGEHGTHSTLRKGKASKAKRRDRFVYHSHLRQSAPHQGRNLLDYWPPVEATLSMSQTRARISKTVLTTLITKVAAER